MRRRTALRALGASALVSATAGCLGTRVPDSLSVDRETTTAADALRTVRVSDSDATPDSVDAAFSVTVRRSIVTPERTAEIRVGFANQGETTAAYSFGDYPPFTTVRSVESDPAVLLLSPDGTYERSSPTCWRPADAPSIGADGLAEQVTLDPDGSVHRDAELWGSPENAPDACLPTGTFRFENRYRFAETDPFVWGFTLEIAEQ